MILIGHSPPDGNECTNYQAAVDRSRLEVELNCSYDGRSVVICVQYAVGGCRSQVANSMPPIMGKSAHFNRNLWHE